MIDNLSIAFHSFDMWVLTSLSVDEMLVPRHVNGSTSFRDLPLRVDMAFYIYIYIALFGPVKPELGVIPSGQKKKKKKFNGEHLNFPGKDLNVTDITEQLFL